MGVTKEEDEEKEEEVFDDPKNHPLRQYNHDQRSYHVEMSVNQQNKKMKQ